MAEFLLEFEGVSYTYPQAEASTLRALTLRLPPGKKAALVGQNGCGKSTLFLLADGLCKPNEGIIKFSGVPLSYRPSVLNQWRRQIGLVFQDPEQQLVAPTVAADVSYGLCNLQLPEIDIERQVGQVLSEFNLQTLAQTPIHHLSLGQKKRVSLAGVMALQPQLLLLDEPTAYLDAPQTRNLLRELDKIFCQGTTLLVATHNLEFVYEWADWIFVMHEGQLVLEGDLEFVFGQSELLTALGLETPLIWQIWQALPLKFRTCPRPRKIEHLIAQINNVGESI